MAEQLGVVHRHERAGAVGEALIVGERALEGLNKILGVPGDALERGVRIIRLFGAKVRLLLGDAPVPKATRVKLLVELQVVLVAGIARLARPNLDRRLRVAGENGDPVWK